MTQPASPDAIRRVIQRYFDLHNDRDWPGLSSLFTPDISLTHPVFPPSTGKDAVAPFFTDYIPSRFPKYYEYVANSIVEGNQAAVEWVFEATRADGQSVTLKGANIFQFEGERIRAIKIFLDPKGLQS